MNTRKLLCAFLAAVMLLGTLSVGMTTYAADITYSDVNEDMWAYKDIVYVTENGLMNGTGGSTFSPAVSLTRAMVVTVLYRMEGAPRVDFMDLFLDVKDREYYSEAVIWAKQNGIVTATSVTEWGEEYFSPNRDITRQELATMFVRFAKFKYINTDTTTNLDKFTDKASVADWASDAMKWATSVGLINGTGNGSTLSPTGKATREQFAAIIHRFDTTEFKYDHNFSEPMPLSTYTEKPYALVDNADLYVAVDGNDKNPGTLTKPLASFEAAKAKVRELKKTAKDEIVVAFKAGNYGVLDNVTFTKEDAGTETAPVKYCKYGDGDVIFQNGIVIAPDEFTPISDSDKSLFKAEAQPYIYKVNLKGKIDKFSFNTRLFSETGVVNEARFPDWSYYTNLTTTVDDHASIMLQGYLPGIVEKFKSFEGLKITGFLRTGWLIDCFPVKSYVTETDIIVFDFENAPFDNGYSLDQFPLMFEGRTDDWVFFSNLPEFLDFDNEFWFDNNTSTLYVYNPKGTYAVDTGIGSFLTAEEGADHLSFVGFEFSTTSDTAIYVKSDYFTMDLCTICNVSGQAAIDATSVVNFTLKNSEIYNCVSYCVILSSGIKNYWDLIPGNNVIENNYFHDFTLPEYFSSGISLSDVGAKVAHNYFYEGGHGGISYYGIDNVIEYNVFDNIMTRSQDFGAVYYFQGTTARSNHIRYNIFKNIPVYAIYLDNDTCGQKVYGNVFYNNSVSIVHNGGRENEIYDNVFLKKGSVTSNAGFYDYITNGNPEEIVNSEYYKRYCNSKPQKGDPNYEKWYERWPELYDFNIDPEKVGDIDCLFTTVTYLKNNAGFGVKINEASLIQKFGVDENNRIFSLDENPYFVNPAVGDYRVLDGADFFKIPYEKIGRY